MNKSIQHTALVLTLGFAFVGVARPAQGASIEESVQAMTKRAIETAAQNFAAIRGASRELPNPRYQTFDVLQTGSHFGDLVIEHIEAEADHGDLWQLSFGVTVPWSRDEVPAQVQQLLGPIIPQNFVYKGIDTSAIDSDKPDSITVVWKGPNNVLVRVHSFELDGQRSITFFIEHELPR